MPRAYDTLCHLFRSRTLKSCSRSPVRSTSTSSAQTVTIFELSLEAKPKPVLRNGLSQACLLGNGRVHRPCAIRKVDETVMAVLAPTKQCGKPSVKILSAIGKVRDQFPAGKNKRAGLLFELLSVGLSRACLGNLELGLAMKLSVSNLHLNMNTQAPRGCGVLFAPFIYV